MGYRPITSYAILTEGTRKSRPDTYQRAFMGTELLYQYNVLKIADLDDEALYADANPFALAVLVAKTAFIDRDIKDRRERDQALLEAKRRLMKAMLDKDIPKQKIRSLNGQEAGALWVLKNFVYPFVATSAALAMSI